MRGESNHDRARQQQRRRQSSTTTMFSVHADQVAQREKLKGREIVKRGVGKR